jgi:UDPglucose 6-dehydrogenase
LIKYANNAFLATKISFINTIANICEKTPEADVKVVAKGIGLDHRISPSFLNAGLGYGGSCLPKDVKALIAYSKEVGYKPQLLEATEEVNYLQPLRAIEMLRNLVGDIKGRRFAILGLAFKPDTDDMREAVSIEIIEKLLEEGAKVSAYDPQAKENAKKIFGKKITYAPSMPSCLKGADGCVIVTEWDEFKTLKSEDLDELRTSILVDGRRIGDPERFKGKVIYTAIGLGPKKPNPTS